MKTFLPSQKTSHGHFLQHKAGKSFKLLKAHVSFQNYSSYYCTDKRMSVKLAIEDDSTAADTIDATCQWNSEDWDLKLNDLSCVCKDFPRLSRRLTLAQSQFKSSCSNSLLRLPNASSGL